MSLTLKQQTLKTIQQQPQHVYINSEWSSNVAITTVHFLTLMVVLAVRYKPFYLPREFSSVIIVAVYIPPSTSANDKANGTLDEIYGIISELLTVHLDSFFIVTEDFNNTLLKRVLLKFHQHIDFATHEENMPELVYTNIHCVRMAAPAIVSSPRQ